MRPAEGLRYQPRRRAWVFYVRGRAIAAATSTAVALDPGAFDLWLSEAESRAFILELELERAGADPWGRLPGRPLGTELGGPSNFRLEGHALADLIEEAIPDVVEVLREGHPGYRTRNVRK